MTCLSSKNPNNIFASLRRFWGSILIIILLDTILSAVSSILWIRTTKQLAEYSFFYVQIFYPLLAVIIMWPIYCIWSLYKKAIKCIKKTRNYRKSDDSDIDLNYLKKGSKKPIYSSLNSSNTIYFRYFKKTQAKRISYIIMALLDSIASVLQLLPIIYLSTTLVILFGQISLPLVLIISRIALNRKYNIIQYICVALLIQGIIIVFIPTLINPETTLQNFFNNNNNNNNNSTIVFDESLLNNSTNTSPSDSQNTNQISLKDIGLFTLFFFLSRIIGSLSTVFKEYSTKLFNLESFFTTIVVATIQVPLNLVTLFIIQLPLPYIGFNRSFQQVSSYVIESFQMLYYSGESCKVYQHNNFTVGSVQVVFENNTYTNPNNITLFNNVTPSVYFMHMCSLIPIILSITLISIFTNSADIFITKKKDSAINSICNLGTMVISICLTRWPALSGIASTNLTIYDILGLITIFFAATLYYAFNNRIVTTRSTLPPSLDVSDEKDIPAEGHISRP